VIASWPPASGLEGEIISSAVLLVHVRVRTKKLVILPMRDVASSSMNSLEGHNSKEIALAEKSSVRLPDGNHGTTLGPHSCLLQYLHGRK
jgi:hypothetical protein